jgi:hypothetical protein
LLLTSALFTPSSLNAQEPASAPEEIYLYNPQRYNQQDTGKTTEFDLIRQQQIQDSIAARQQFIQDSIAARLKFIQDSIARRQRIHDSIVYLKKELPRILEAYIRAISDQIIVKSYEIPVKGDSMLGNYEYMVLPFGLEQPYTPWKPKIYLNSKAVKIKYDPGTKNITSLQVPSIVCTLNYGSNILIINEQTAILNNRWGKFFKIPVDSVFFDKSGKIVKIKRYIHFHQATSNYQKGAFLFTHLAEVKQFEYTASNELSRFQWTSFCDRWAAYDPKKVCNIATFTITRQGSNYIVKRENDPKNNFAEGNFTFEVDNAGILKSVSFLNVSSTEDWKTFIELNEAGNVSRYVYQNKGVVNKTLLVNYYDDPKAPNKVETVTCIFEDDGISYYQQNNTTGKVRERDRTTGEWGPWK